MSDLIIMSRNQDMHAKSPNLTELDESHFKSLKHRCMESLCEDETSTLYMNSNPKQQVAENTENSESSVSVANQDHTALPVLDTTEDVIHTSSMVSLNESVKSAMSHSALGIANKTASQLRSQKRPSLRKSRSYIEISTPNEDDFEKSFFRNAFSDEEEETEEGMFSEDFLMKSSPATVFAEMKNQKKHSGAKSLISGLRDKNANVAFTPTKVDVAKWLQEIIYSPGQKKRSVKS